MELENLNRDVDGCVCCGGTAVTGGTTVGSESKWLLK